MPKKSLGKKRPKNNLQSSGVPSLSELSLKISNFTGEKPIICSFPSLLGLAVPSLQFQQVILAVTGTFCNNAGTDARKASSGIHTEATSNLEGLRPVSSIAQERERIEGTGSIK